MSYIAKALMLAVALVVTSSTPALADTRTDSGSVLVKPDTMGWPPGGRCPSNR